jgi:hydrogenase maturation protein HypF
MQALELLVTGAVQGVGFRPFVYRLAHEMGLGGAVWNEPRGVRLRVVGPERAIENFCWRVKHDAPVPARVDALQLLEARPAVAPEPFRIVESQDEGARTAVIMADLATCPACRAELFDPANRRHRYPFINCTHCGPRYSIVTALPYDRPHTTMRGFALCPACRAEYEDPSDRRFHAQPNACPACGPQLAWWDDEGRVEAVREAALQAAVQALRDGRIVAVKGIGGFHLVCDASNPRAVETLRVRKHREEKPFAVMVPDDTAARALARISDLELELLRASAAPIVLLPRREGAALADEVAPGNPNLGLLLPYAPLHHLLLHDFGRPLVATSGNRSDEPLCTDEREALQRLRGLADAFLVHNRPIARPLDDSIVRVLAGKPCILRRARGYTPLPIPLSFEAPPLLALGAHLKNTIALASGRSIVVSQHIGDLDALEARDAFERAVDDVQALRQLQPAGWVTDRHPDYASSLYARDRGLAAVTVQHHHAHVASCMAEHGLERTVLGVAWDGTGLGDDRTIWGGEFLVAGFGSCQRVGTISGFHLPGGDGAMRKPLSSAVGLLQAFFPEAMPRLAVELLGLEEGAVRQLMALITRRANAPYTTSVGRWFDGLSALCGLCRASTFEGQAAMALEWAATPHRERAAYPFEIRRADDLLVADLRATLVRVIEDLRSGVEAGAVAASFHHTLAEVVVGMAERQRGLPVVLTGGCFQNQLLLERCVLRLRETGHTPYWHQLVPPNDGGISLGQAAVAAYLQQGTAG